MLQQICESVSIAHDWEDNIIIHLDIEICVDDDKDRID